VILDPEEYEHYCTITAAEPDGVRALVTLRTTYDQVALLADYNIAETVSAVRHLPGFQQAAFYLARNEPVLVEHVAWETGEHYAAARTHPSFTRHLHHVDAVAEVTVRIL